MKGTPKYNYGDKVVITVDQQEHVGEIYIIDKYGTWEDPSDVSYDVMIYDFVYPDGEGKVSDCLCKHITEKDVKPYVAN